VRIEELAPFPFVQLRNVLARYSSAGVRDYVWLQEEPKNQGAWTHVNRRIAEVMGDMGYGQDVKYAGRKESAVSAPGISRFYKEQQQAILDAAFEGL
jgi:probable 2-oxoglutarate dehydrogenase E1 component DHKTD1